MVPPLLLLAPWRFKNRDINLKAQTGIHSQTRSLKFETSSYRTEINEEFKKLRVLCFPLEKVNEIYCCSYYINAIIDLLDVLGDFLSPNANF